MTITPSQFGLTIDSTSYHITLLILPAIEAPADWCDADPPQNRMHRCRGRSHVDVAAGDTLFTKFQLDESAAQAFTETLSGAISDTWSPATWATANETSAHVHHHTSVPNDTPSSMSHRYVEVDIRHKENAGNTGDPELNAVEIGWPHDESYSASDPVVELSTRAAGHVAESYHAGASWLAAWALLGTLRRMQYEAYYRMSYVYGDKR